MEFVVLITFLEFPTMTAANVPLCYTRLLFQTGKKHRTCSRFDFRGVTSKSVKN